MSCCGSDKDKAAFLRHRRALSGGAPADGKRNWKKTPLALSIFMVTTAHALPGFAAADSKTFQFNIPAENMASALLAFSETTDIQLSYSASLVKGLRSPKLSGAYTVEQALDKLLARSDIAYRFADDNVVALQSAAHTPAESSAKDSGDAKMLKSVRVTAEALGESEDTPDNTLYTRSSAGSANRTDTPIMETPIAIQVVPRAVLQDQQSVQVGDAIKNVSGVFQGLTFGGFAEQFMIRGFNTNFNNYLDGFAWPASRLTLANAERVEVVKGAAANLYGRIQPGGMINVVTKRPQATPYYAFEQQFGSWDLYRTTLDATGAVNADASLLYRLNFEYLDKQSFRDFGFTDRIFLAPSITWKIGERTQLDVDFMYSDEDTLEDYGVVASPTTRRPIDIPISRYLGEPTTDKSNTTLYNTAVTLSHAFTDNWKARARFNYLRRDVLDLQTFPPPFGLNEQTGELQRFFYGANAASDTYYGLVDINGRFVTWGAEHQVTVGWEHYNSESILDTVFANANAINIYNPQYQPADVAQIWADSIRDGARFIQDGRGSNSNGIYVQDQITLFDKLHLLGGGRYDWITDVSGSSAVSFADAAANRTKINNDRFSPRFGILYQPWPWLSVYGNYSESLGSANGAIDAGGKLLQPEIGEQYEAGFKTSFFEERLTSNVAFYHLTKKNMAVGVLGSPFSVAIGEARSQGVEIDITGRVTDGLSLIATYAYTDAAILKGDDAGKRLWNVPRNAGSLWLKYDLQEEALRGLSVGAGVYLQGQKEGNIANTFQLPGYGRIDTLLRYQLPVAKSKLTMQFNIENLLDHRYYTSSSAFNSNFVNPGAPRTFMGSVKVEF